MTRNRIYLIIGAAFCLFILYFLVVEFLRQPYDDIRYELFGVGCFVIGVFVGLAIAEARNNPSK
jgi:hypothetical protein